MKAYASIGSRPVFVFVLLFSVSGIAASTASAEDGLPRHPLELRALREPEAVLQALPAEIATAERSADQATLALLHLARANACRVSGRWACQRDAGMDARAAGERAQQPILILRGIVAESRGRISLQDFSRGERLLGEAESVLRQSPNAEIAADIQLAYSTLGHVLGKHELAVEHARNGLSALSPGQAPAMQARLLRNLGRAEANLGDFDAARSSFDRAQAQADVADDPKLSAEMQLELARIAALSGDIEQQARSGAIVVAAGQRLRNRQLEGFGREVIGLAALSSGDQAKAEEELRAAIGVFHKFDLPRDELRASRSLVGSLLDRADGAQELRVLVRRILVLVRDVNERDRAAAGDDFDARLKYEQQNFDLARLAQEAALAREREFALNAQNRFNRVLMLGGMLCLFGLLVFFVVQRRAAKLLSKAHARIAANEHRLRTLTDNIPAMIAHIDGEQRYTFVNAYFRKIFAIDPDGLIGRCMREVRGEAVYADIREHVEAALRGVPARFEGKGEVNGRTYYYLSQYVPDELPDGRLHGFFALTFDITDLKLAERELEKLARFDALTGVANRRHFEERLALAAARSRRQGLPIALLFLDIDHFKSINDRLGHAGGDDVIREFARRLQCNVREEDLVARLGGDEFVILIEFADSLELAEAVARKLIASMQEPMHVAGELLSITTSIGVAFAVPDADPGALLALADGALYAAKRAGRNTFSVAEGNQSIGGAA